MELLIGIIVILGIGYFIITKTGKATTKSVAPAVAVVEEPVAVVAETAVAVVEEPVAVVAETAVAVVQEPVKKARKPRAPKAETAKKPVAKKASVKKSKTK